MAILGPYEALLAELMWVAEAYPAAAKTLGDDVRSFFPTKPRVDQRMREHILLTLLLHGQLDTSAAIPYFDPGLRREWEEEVVPDLQRDRPLHRVSYGKAIYGFLNTEVDIDDDTALFTGSEYLRAAIDLEQVPEPVQRAVIRVMGRKGYRSINGRPLGDYVRSELSNYVWPPLLTGRDQNCMVMLSRTAAAAQMVYTAIDRSIETGCRFVSRDALAPAWVTRDATDQEFAVLRMVLESPVGPTAPTTMREVVALNHDIRVVQLREWVADATAKLVGGSARDIERIRRDLDSGTSAGRNIHRAKGTASVVTYIAVPVGIAEIVTGTIGPGLGLSALGAVSEGLAAMLRRRGVRHWTSM